jgi:hypothetical protein
MEDLLKKQAKLLDLAFSGLQAYTDFCTKMYKVLADECYYACPKCETLPSDCTLTQGHTCPHECSQGHKW